MIKKLAILSAVLMLAACSQLTGSGGGSKSDSTTARLKACTYEEATRKVTEGTAFLQPMGTSVDQITDFCLKKLALQSAGLDNQASDNAMSALSSLMGAASAFKK